MGMEQRQVAQHFCRFGKQTFSEGCGWVVAGYTVRAPFVVNICGDCRRTGKSNTAQ